VPAKKPSLGAVLAGLVPFAAICLAVPFWDRIDPIILGLPFNLFWLVSWIVLASACMWIAYRLETTRERDGNR
jgi:hypothetical protein